MNSNTSVKKRVKKNPSSIKYRKKNLEFSKASVIFYEVVLQ